MELADKIVEKAKEYLGTPFRHQGRLKGIGVDCAGLVICVAHDLKISDFDFTQYGRTPNAGTLQSIMQQHMERISINEVKPGDVYLMKFDKEPQHLAIVSHYGIIHAYAEVKKVVEHGLDDVWKSRIVAAFRYKGK